MSSFNDFYEESIKVIEKCEKKREAKLEIEFEHLLKKYFDWIGIPDIEGQYEQKPGSILVVSNKRQDATYGKVIIEYEPVGSLENLGNKNHSIKQVRDDYLSTYSREQRKDMVGIVFDGKIIIFVRWVSNDWNYDEREYDKHSFSMMINYLIGLYKISFNELPSHFGINKSETRDALKILYDKSITDNKRVNMLFNEWNLRYSSIYGNAFKKEKIQNHFKEFAGEIGIDKVDEKRVIFIIHTYYAFIIKIIAAEVSLNLFDYSPQAHLKYFISSKNLKDNLKNIEEGKFFRDIGVDNFIEGTFLSWYIDIWDEDIQAILENIINKIDLFDFAEFTTKPEYVIDYLKEFYQEVFPKQLRHDLGEFYTPDWLASYLVNITKYEGDIEQRILDPACGSGTFLIAILNKIYNHYNNEKHKEKLVEKIINNIVGFDINPVAVLTARTNYLISLSRFNFQNTKIFIPIYLTDSINLPELDTQITLDNGSISYNIKTTKGTFSIPYELKNNINEIMTLLKENIEKEMSVKDVKEVLIKKYNFNKDIIKSLIKFYSRIDELNREKENKIWCDIITNQFATLFQSKFDYVIGNPPWVNWEFLDDEYQKSLTRINDDYGLYVTKGYESSLGKIKRDLSAIFFYVCSDIYLKDTGIIAFIIKPMYQIPSGVGFRNFNRLTKKIKIKKMKIPLKILSVEDVTKENPFEIGNEVSLLCAIKGQKTKYPLQFKKWSGKRVHELIEYKAEPSDKKDETSTWMIYSGEKPKSALGIMPYKIREGVNFGLREAFFDLEIVVDKGDMIQIKNDEGKIKDIEKGRIYPIVKSRHINRWYLSDKNSEQYTYCILPQDDLDEDNEHELKRDYPKTWEWLNDFKEKLQKRSSKNFKKKPFYSIFGLGNWNSKYKIAWKSMGFYPDFVVMSTVDDKFLNRKILLAEHVINFIPVENEDEAHYICAVLNSSVIGNTLKALSSKSKSGLSHTIVNKLKIEKYNPKDQNHTKLSELSKKAHKTPDDTKVTEIEKNINEILLGIY